MARKPGSMAGYFHFDLFLPVLVFTFLCIVSTSEEVGVFQFFFWEMRLR
jgi:hypothetical protein